MQPPLIVLCVLCVRAVCKMLFSVVSCHVSVVVVVAVLFIIVHVSSLAL